MPRYTVRFHADDAPIGTRFALDAPSVPIALVIADINMRGGTAEIWKGERRVALMRKRKGQQQAFWELY